MAISAKEAALLIAIVPFVVMGILLLQRSKMLSKIYGELPSSQKVHISSNITPAQSQPQKTIDEDVFEDVVQDVETLMSFVIMLAQLNPLI